MHSLLEHMESYHQLEEDRKFRCDECGRSYRHAGSLANHKKTHDVGSFHCPVCSRQLSNALALKSHLRTHTSHKNYSCFECGKAFRLATQLATHEKVHRNREARERTKRKHELDYSIGDGCIDDQLQDFNAVPDLQSDLGLDIAPENSLSNSGMPDLVPSSTPESDMSGDVGDRPFKCDLCEKTYRHHGSLINHRKSHQMGLFECPVCFKQFSNLAALNSHQRTHNKSRDQPSTAIPESVQRDSKPEKAFPTPQNGPTNVNFCHLCQVSFPSDDEFQNHILLHNSSSVSFELADDMAEDHHFPYNHNVTQPSEANPYSPNDTQLMPPLLDKEKDFNQMERPVENGQIYIPQLIDDNPCSLDTQGMPMTLGSENASSDSQLSEMDINEVKQEGAYNSDRRFKCHICGKSYRHAGSLINHKRSHQTGIFQCSICRKNYPHLAALRSHLRIHRARPSSSTHSAEGDWLSSEPLTLENQQGCFPSQEGEDGSLLDLPHDFQDSAQLKEESNEQETTEFHNQFDMSYPQDSELHLPQGEPLMEHMCADCGETFSDIAGIKSHMCPHLHQQFQALPNGSAGHLIPQKAKQQHFLGESEEHIVFEGHNNNDTKPFIDENNLHRNMHGQLISDGEDKGHDDEGEEDDGEMYQCSVCGNHYTSMRALRSHLRGHTQIHGTPSSGPSSLSSVEVEREDKPGASLQGDDSLMICSTCGESFTKSQDLLSHQLLHSGLDIDKPENYSMHNQSSLKLKEELESIICGKCGVVCTSFQQLDTHSCTGQRQGDSMKCDEELHPGNGFGQELRHFNGSAGNRERQYTCDQCGRTYRHAGSLLNHKKSHKTGVFRCYVCQKRFYNLLALKNHQRTHFDVKKHSCTECGKAFKIHKQLLTHQRVHQENKAKIKELNEQIQSLMQMNGNSSVSGMQPFTGNKKRTARRRKQKETPNSETTCTMKEDQTGDPDNPRPYVCDQCGRSYRHAGSLVNHKNSHKTGEYYCAVCKNTYSNQLAMKNHLRIHFAVKKHCCQDCGKGFRGKKQLLSHNCSHNRKNIGAKGRGRRRTKDLTCKKCRLVFPSTNQLADHTCAKEPKLHTIPQGGEQCVGVTDVPGGETVQKEERPFKCNICGRSYRHAGSLLNHKNTHKTGHFKCTFCAKPFSNPMALRNHTRIHTQKKKFVCPTCGKAFRLSSILHNHMKIHARAVTHFSCEACGKSFQGKSGLKRHRCNRNGPSDADDSHREGGDKCYMCDQCGRSYRHAGSLLNHKKTHSADLLHCSLCLKTFSDPLELQSHSQMVRHCCPDCGKTFCEFSHMQSHMEVHSKGHPYYCNICQQSLPNMVSFQQHQVLHQNIQGQTHHPHMTNGMQMDQHTEFQGLPQLSPASRQAQVSFPDPHELQGASGDALEREEKSHVCEHCGRTYRHAGSLLNHKNSHKMGSFFCSVCQKEFTNLMALKNHRRIHTEPKRYQCLECGKAFRVSTQLICHRRIHTKEKPFSCLLCDKRFSSKSNLRHHQKMHQNTQNAFESSFNMDVNAFMGLDVDPFL